jgi:hypothetical protein
MLNARVHQGQFGEDYVRVLASAAGLVVLSQSIDSDGVDLGFRFPGRVRRAASPLIEAQIKSWSRPRCSQGCWNYNGLTERQFNQLAGPDFTAPRFLFLVIVPPDPGEYLRFSTDGMLLRQLGFFCSFHDEARIEPPRARKRRPVRVPVGNVLTPSSLRRLVHPDLAMGRTG